MLLLGGSALYAFAVRLVMTLAPYGPIGRVALLALFAAATLLAPDGLAAACLATGWLLTFALGKRAGWGLFALGAALMGRAAVPGALWRTALGQPSTAGIIGLVALTVVATIGVQVHGASPSYQRRRSVVATTAARGLLLIVARRYAPRGKDDAWRTRAADALARAGAALSSTAMRSGSRPRADELASRVCGALEMLAGGDPRGAATRLAAIRVRPPTGAGVAVLRSEQVGDWAEAAAWCELATRLIAFEEDAQ